MNAAPALDGPAVGPLDAALKAIAHDALLDHLNRGDARHALALALDLLGARLQCACALQALDAGGATRWRLGPEAAAAPWVSVPVSRLGQAVGTLALGLEAKPAELATTLDPLLPALSALLLHDAQVGASPGAASGGLAAMIRAALAGAGTFVWEWDIDSDQLGDIEEGLSQLGYPVGGAGRTQDAWNRLIHPDDVDANHEAYLRHARGETQFYEHAYRVKAHDGSWRWYLERGRIVDRHADGQPSRMVGMQTDITERRAIEAQVSHATERLAKIARHAPGVLCQFTLDDEGRARFSYVSERARELFGLEPADILHDAQTLMDIVAADDQHALLESVRVSGRALAEWQREFRIRLADGQERWILGMATPQSDGDGGVAWHGYLQDMTTQRELEAARRDTLAAEAANRAKTEFLSRMSHELRTPLNAVLGFAQLLEIDRAHPLAPPQRKRVQLIREAGEHLLVMIGDLLDLTRIESGSMIVQQVPVPLHALATEALQMVQASADAELIRLGLRPDPQHLCARGDRTRLRQVLLNLLSNAVKYNRRGGEVEVSIAPGQPGRVVLSVRDTGVGIAPEDLTQVFEPFQRGAHEGGRIEGTGIGLSVTRSLVQLMHGEISVQSRPGFGTLFTVMLPDARAG